MVRGAGGRAVVLVEFEVGTLGAGDQVVDVQGAATVAAEEAGAGTAATVAFENARANGKPGG